MFSVGKGRIGHANLTRSTFSPALVSTSHFTAHIPQVRVQLPKQQAPIPYNLALVVDSVGCPVCFIRHAAARSVESQYSQ